jgi:mevalonate kinase
MFTGIALQTADLKWLVPMVIGSLTLLGCVAAFIWRPNRDWTSLPIPVLAVALIGASVFTKVSVTKDGFTIETAQLSAQVLTDLQTVTKANSDAISQLTTRLDDLATVTKKVAEAQPANASHAAEFSQITQATQKIQSILKTNQDLLKGVGANNELIKMQIESAKRTIF